MNQVSLLARRYGFDALIVIAAIESVLEVVLRDDSLLMPQRRSGSRTSHHAHCPATAWRRRLPFAAPMLLWLLAAALSFVDGQLVAETAGVFFAGMASAFLLGNLPDVIQVRIGLAVTLGGAAIVVYNSPNRVPGQFIFIPLLFAIAWLGGFALRERAAQAEAAEERAARAERERETAARIAVAEERAASRVSFTTLSLMP